MTEFFLDVISFISRSSPGATSGQAKLYGKDVSGITGLYGQSSNGTEHQLTPSVAVDLGISSSQLSTILTFGDGSTLTNATGAQSIFPAGNDRITLESNTIYLMKMLLLTRRTGTTSNTVSFIFNAGTVSYNSFKWSCASYSSTTALQASIIPWQQQANVATATAVTAAGAQTYRLFYFDGLIDVSGSGTFIPQWSYNNLPGSTTIIGSGSFMELIPIGPTGYISQGGWS